MASSAGAAVAVLKGQQQQQHQHAAAAAASSAAESAALRSGAAGLAEELSSRQRSLLSDMAALAAEIENYRCVFPVAHKAFSFGHVLFLQSNRACTCFSSCQRCLHHSLSSLAMGQ